ncbi:uncharacterized protein LOC122014549 [Zingiber officinale]|uniref:Uncharacterized protein n=1 Tax=Zingiber officinale TaxID=94328 RepID=A0A8J5F3L6_ZINOF|nr:uncharacterized protein LOC122014549 [Zingiber officinale]KAG6481028.1 hypothetical protein ZIOFF_057619 [Zingiber officinale]
MDLSPGTENYIKESIESSLGLPVSVKSLRLKLLASEDSRNRLQDQVFVLEERLQDSNKRMEQCRAEANMNAQGVRRCVEEKEIYASKYGDLLTHCRKLEEECSLYEHDLERIMESCDELGKENEELQSRLQDASNLESLATKIETLNKDKEHLRTNLHTAEEEVKILFQENKMLDEENKRLLELLKTERQRQGSNSHKRSASAAAKGKRKSRPNDGSPFGLRIDFESSDSSRLPLSPIHQNLPESRMHKKVPSTQCSS